MKIERLSNSQDLINKSWAAEEHAAAVKEFNAAIGGGVRLPLNQEASEKSAFWLTSRFDNFLRNGKVIRILRSFDFSVTGYLLPLDTPVLRGLFKQEIFETFDEVLMHLAKVIRGEIHEYKPEGNNNPKAPLRGDRGEYINISGVAPSAIVSAETIVSDMEDFVECKLHFAPPKRKGRVPTSYFLPSLTMGGEGLILKPRPFPCRVNGQGPLWTWEVNTTALLGKEAMKTKYEVISSIRLLSKETFGGTSPLNQLWEQLIKDARAKALEQEAEAAKKAASKSKGTAVPKPGGNPGGSAGGIPPAEPPAAGGPRFPEL